MARSKANRAKCNARKYGTVYTRTEKRKDPANSPLWLVLIILQTLAFPFFVLWDILKETK